ncbi:ABC transporter ATP-binding protein [Asticcacaulis endophyticus]|uniref:Lipoprotein-releasing system ATP-binding protein LolD n=1 Tax=Asticcacaulis endophyticus TaxID=1395890 RepID=A0A918QA11_9CAUL|nr:ABC transporter ATP-binding protein [Asticcacaulis endophyticus]GGZ37277.1 lipoprotein-releasing system ATP-binding protein LolD [Asticcacaulis endophyticus]
MSNKTVVMSLRGLNRTYNVAEGAQLEVLKGVDLDLYAGEVVGLVGPSGSGKSSLLHCVGLLETSEEAQLIIDGEDLTRANDKLRTRARLTKIGFVYQFHHLLPEFTALGNVALPQRVLGRSVREAEARAKALLEQVGLGERLNHQPAQLSGGEQQRVAIARALVNSPRLLLADEPTGNLDPDTSKQVFEALKQTVRHQQVAALIATHNLELARHMDRVVTIQNGKLTELSTSAV